MEDKDPVMLMEGWREQAEQALRVAFAWSWVVAYKSARIQAGRDRLRYRVRGERWPESPTGWRFTWEPEKAPDQPCPVCGSETERTADCPSYKRALGGWQRCSPASACGDAATWHCTRKGCGWFFASGYAWENPNNQWMLAERGVVPEWLGSQA